MIPLNILLAGLLIHWLADFVLQTPYQAENKYNNFTALTTHVLNYSLVWFGFILVCTDMNLNLAAGFFLITFITHLFTDWITSVLTHKLFEQKDYHNGLVVVGADQILHYIQLYITFQLIVF